MTLTEFVVEKIAIALNYRNLSLHNPVEILVEGNGTTYVVLVSLLEPDTLTVPYNVLWINADPEHEDYAVLMRRVDAEKYDDKDYRGSWSVLSTLDEIYTEEQYYKKDSDPILGEVQQFRPSLASTVSSGGFFVTANGTTPENDRIAIGTNDPRMSNPRAPLAHSHPDVPRTLLSTGDGSGRYVSIPSTDPVAGYLLFITAATEDGNFIAEWLPPTTEFAYVGPLPTSVTVIGPTQKVAGNTNHILRANVAIDDGTTQFSVKATWTITNNGAYASVNASTGVFHAGVVPVDTPVTVRATWTHPESGTTVFKNYVITIAGDPSVVTLSSIAIVGPAQFPKNQTGTYTVRATFSNATTLTVTPNAFVSSNADAGTFVGGVLTPKSGQVRDVLTTLSATYVSNGITRTASLAVTIKDPTIYPSSIAITGAASVDQATTSTYTARVTNSDGSTAAVTGVWSMTDTANATITQGGGVLSAKALTTQGSKTAEVNVSYTSNGINVTAKKTVTIADTKNWPVSAVINGVDSVEPAGTSTYTYTVTYKNGATSAKTPTWTTSNTARATIASTGVLTGVAAGSVNVLATYTEDGVNLNATKTITIASASVAIPPLRYGVAMFSNRNFTGGPIVSEITQEERDYGVTDNTSPSGKTYTHWTGFTNFVASALTKTAALPTDGSSLTLTTTITVDDYTYIMWDARAGDIELIDLANGFTVTFDGIYYRNDVLGNESGLPGYDPNLPKVMTINFDDGNGVRPWKIVRSEATTLAQYSPRTNQYSIKYKA